MGIEYCELYDLGYTSLGGVNDTRPNPALRVPVAGDGEGDVERTYTCRPAYELDDGAKERWGRE